MTSRSTCVRVHVTDSVPVEPACGDATSLQLEAGVDWLPVSGRRAQKGEGGGGAQAAAIFPACCVDAEATSKTPLFISTIATCRRQHQD